MRGREKTIRNKQLSETPLALTTMLRLGCAWPHPTRLNSPQCLLGPGEGRSEGCVCLYLTVQGQKLDFRTLLSLASLGAESSWLRDILGLTDLGYGDTGQWCLVDTTCSEDFRGAGFSLRLQGPVQGQ